METAGKASEKDISIIVSADETGFTVEDFGKGIPRQEIDRVTEAFYMVDKSRTGNTGGAGLGLAICQNGRQRWKRRRNHIRQRRKNRR